MYIIDGAVYIIVTTQQVIVIYQDKSFIELRASAMGACAVSCAQLKPHPLAEIQFALY